MTGILVAGSAHLDVLARATARDDVVDRIGNVSIEVGGTACNIAINLAHAGVGVRFLSAMNASAYSKVIVDYLKAMNVEPHIEYHDHLPTGAFSVHMDTAGEMVSAVSSMPVEQVNFDSERIATAIDGVAAVVLDCNLSALAINRIVAIANDRKVPVYIAAVSEEKSLRIGNITGAIAGVFCNAAEYRFFSRVFHGEERPPADTARTMGVTFIVTNGAAGSTIAFPDGRTAQVPPCSILEGAGSRLGMGDAFAAGIVLLHEVHQLPLETAAHQALEMASWVGSSQHCHPGKTKALESAIDRIHHHAGHDAMTGALNRHSTEQAIAAALAGYHQGRLRALSLLILDIDHFKSVNDTYGHNTGDQVIIGVARIVAKCLRSTDVLGRWGGEEFIVVLPGTPEADALAVANRIRSAIQECITSPRPITVSVGCSEAGADGAEDLTSLVDLADNALYQAKRSGRNKVVSASALEQAVVPGR